MASRICISMALAAALLFLGAPSASGVDPFVAPEKRPVLVAFDFESAFDGGILGRRVGEMFRGRAMRAHVFTSIDSVSFREIIDANEAKVGHAATPAEVIALAHRLYQAQFAIWGKVERRGRDTYLLSVRIARLANGKAKLLIEETYTCRGIHDVPVKVDLPFLALRGLEQAKRPDLLANTNWKQRPNLVVNPGFETGGITPAKWEPVNGLTSFWVKGESPAGRCIMFDTDVDGDQAKEWEKRFAGGAPASAAPRKKPTKPPKYDTVGGTFGAHVYSDWIPIKQGVTYRVDVDVRGPHGNAKVFVKGYAEFEGGEFAGGATAFGKVGLTRLGKAQRREIYRAPLHLHMYGEPDQWEHHAKVFHPTQPLVLLGIHSPFDGRKSGGRLHALIREAIEKRDIILDDAAQTRRALDGMEMVLGANTQRREIAHLIRRTRGRGVAVWGEIIEDEGKGKGTKTLHMLGLNVRLDAWTSYWHKTWEYKGPGQERALAAELAAEIMRQVRPVRWLRVKLDCYWPAGKYYFDNISITEVPPEEDIE